MSACMIVNEWQQHRQEGIERGAKDGRENKGNAGRGNNDAQRKEVDEQG